MSANLCPSPLTLCNWQDFAGRTTTFNFRITDAMRDLFLSKFGTKSIPFAINNMMNFYVNNPSQFHIDWNIYTNVSKTPEGIVEQLANTILKLCIPDHFDGSNSTPRNNVKVSHELHQIFLKNVVNDKNWQGYEYNGKWHWIPTHEYITKYHRLYNFLLLMAIEKLKEIKIVNA